MSRRSPLGAFAGGLVAGFVGVLAQNLFLACTRRVAPQSATHPSQPVEPERRNELPTQTVAPRVTEPLARRGPHESTTGPFQAVHLARGFAWGSAYGLAAGTLPRLSTLKGGLGFGLLVWLISDDVVPAFRSSARPHHLPVHHYPVNARLYAITAHAVYGAAVAATFAALGRAAAPVTAELAARWLTRRVPHLLRPRARRLVKRSVRIALPVRDAWLALS